MSALSCELSATSFRALRLAAQSRQLSAHELVLRSVERVTSGIPTAQHRRREARGTQGVMLQQCSHACRTGGLYH